MTLRKLPVRSLRCLCRTLEVLGLRSMVDFGPVFEVYHLLWLCLCSLLLSLPFFFAPGQGLLEVSPTARLRLLVVLCNKLAWPFGLVGRASFGAGSTPVRVNFQELLGASTKSAGCGRHVDKRRWSR